MGVKKHSSQNDTFRLVFEGGPVCTNFEFFRRKGAYMNLYYFKCLKSACKANAQRMLQSVKTGKFTIIARFDLVGYKIYSTLLAWIWSKFDRICNRYIYLTEIEVYKRCQFFWKPLIESISESKTYVIYKLEKWRCRFETN